MGITYSTDSNQNELTIDKITDALNDGLLLPKPTQNDFRLSAINNINTYLETKVVFFSKPNLSGNMYTIDNGNYTSEKFVKYISPDNVFSMTVPPQTFVKLYCGDMYDDGGKGFYHITNVTNEVAEIPSLPRNIQGNVRSVSIGTQFHEDSYITRIDLSPSPSNEYFNEFEETNNFNFLLILILLILVIVYYKLKY